MTNGEGSNESEILIHLGLGSNIGDREANLREAIARIEALGLEVAGKSSIYETEPVGFTEQPWFLNQVIEVKMLTGLGPGHGPVPLVDDPEVPATIQAEVLLSELLTIEREIGRERTITNGPRVIDIDLLLFGDMTVDRSKAVKARSLIGRAGIVVPHPRMHLRRFVLQPLCDIAPELVHPVLKKPCRELLAEVKDSSMVRLYEGGDIRKRNISSLT